MASNVRRVALLTLLLGLCALTVSADNDLFRFRHYTVANGLASNTVRDLSQDDEGYIWVGTDGGLNRFDGSTFVLFSVADRVFQPSVMALLPVEGGMFVGTDEGIFAFSSVDEQLRPIPLPVSGHNIVSGLARDRYGNIWAANTDHETFIYDAAEGAFLPRELTAEAGLMFLGNRLSVARNDLPRDIQHIHSVFEYSSHQLLLGTDDGLYLYDVSSGSRKLFTDREGDAEALSSRFVYPIFRDREGGIWVGTYYGGVNYVSPCAGQFEAFTPSRYANSVCGSVIGAICEDDDGMVWIGSDDGGFSRYNPADGTFLNFTSHNSRLPYDNVHALLCRDGQLWIGTYSGGICRLDVATRQFTLYPSLPEDDSATPGHSCYALFSDSRGTLWAGTMEGVAVYDAEADTFRHVHPFGAMTIDIREDSRHRLWFATEGSGIFCYHPDEGTWQQFLMGNGQVNSLCFGSHGELWAGVSGGLYRYDESAALFHPVAVPDALRGQNVMGVVEAADRLWITTTRGLFCFAPSDATSPLLTYTMHDGLCNLQFLPNAILKAHDGRIYVGTVSGLNAFYPFALRRNTAVPTVVLTQLDILGQPVAVGSDRLPLALSHTPRIDLTHRDNVFTVAAASLSYCVPENNHYAYRLVGFDRGWTYLATRNSFTFTNLAPGTYTLQVKATNNDGLWSTSEASLQIVVHPPFYLTLLAKIVYLILIVLLLLVAAKYIVYRSNRRHAAEIDKLNAEQEQKAYATKVEYVSRITDIAAHPTDNAFLADLNNLIEENYTNPALSVDFLAGKLCISRSSLFAKVKALTDITPNEMIQMVRLRHAAQLLASGEYRISEVGFQTGFNSPSYFSKCFSKQFGITPGEYAATHHA